MGKLAYVRILLNSHPHGVVRPGDLMKGVLEFNYEEQEKLRGIRIELEGCTRTRWKEADTYNYGSGTNTTCVHYGVKQYHLQMVLVLWGSPSSASRSSVAPAPMGPVSMPFTFQTPPNLPESFESYNPDRVAYTRYYLKAVFDRPWKFDDESKLLFTMVPYVDLNRLSYNNIDSVTQESHFEEDIQMMLYCIPFPCAGKLHLDVRVAKLGYVAGEFIVAYGRVVNNTGRALRGLRLRLVQDVTSFGEQYERTIRFGEPFVPSYGRYSHQHKIITEMGTREKIENGKEFVLGTSPMDASVRMLVPAVPTTRKNDGTPITIEYSLEIYMDSSGFLSVDKKFCPILIGNVPLQNLPMFFDGDQTQPQRSASPSKFKPPPPSYHESVFGSVPVNWDQSEKPQNGSESDKGTSPAYVGEPQKAFAPKYMYYGFKG